MPISFPNTPTPGQYYTEAGITWQWDGSAWNLISGQTVSNGTSGTSGIGISGTSGTSGTGFSTISGATNDRVLTSDGTSNSAVAEANLTFNGSTLTVTGTATVTSTLSAQTLVETSALKYKDNVEDLETINNVYKLRPVSFDWKSTSKHDIGFIAEEVQNLIPELVELNASGEAEGVKYSKMSVIIIKAIQDLSKRVEALEKKENL